LKINISLYFAQKSVFFLKLGGLIHTQILFRFASQLKK